MPSKTNQNQINTNKSANKKAASWKVNSWIKEHSGLELEQQLLDYQIKNDKKAEKNEKQVENHRLGWKGGG